MFYDCLAYSSSRILIMCITSFVLIGCNSFLSKCQYLLPVFETAEQDKKPLTVAQFSVPAHVRIWLQNTNQRKEQMFCWSRRLRWSYYYCKLPETLRYNALSWQLLEWMMTHALVKHHTRHFLIIIKIGYFLMFLIT